MTAPGTRSADNPLIGIWILDEGYQITTLVFRPSGRYHLETRSTDSTLDYVSSERGRYDVSGRTVSLTSYEFYGEAQPKKYEYQIDGDSLSLTTLEYVYTQMYRFEPNSKAAVLEGENSSADLVRTWVRAITFYGTTEYTFRPDGYYVLKSTPSDTQFPPEFVRGRYDRDGSRLTVRPYSGVEARYELDVFGGSLTLITRDEFSGEAATYEERRGSAEEVRARAAEADAFLETDDWLIGTWEVRDAIHAVDVTFRPDSYYLSEEHTEFLKGVVRGRYTLEEKRLVLSPFVGQGIYARSNGEFGKVERTRELDYYDGELQFIDLEALSQSVTIGRKRPESATPVFGKVRQAHEERQRPEWHLGVWEVNDPAGWMEFTYRPDNRYIAMSGASGVPGAVERGRYRIVGNRLTLAPYPGLGPARAFELDFYDGEWFLIGDLARMVVARKNPDSVQGVVERTRDPEALKGERGSILGLWTSNVPGHSAELVFRPDGEFRLSRCVGNVVARDYGLYSADMSTRALLSDSRFINIQTRGLDFYGDTLTIHGGDLPPSTYRVNLGTVDAAIAASLAADAGKAQVDAMWLGRVPIATRDSKAVQFPAGDIPADPHPTRIFDVPQVFSNFQLYRRLTPGFVYFNVQGTIRSVPVVNTSEWYFFPTGRTLVRFRNYRAGAFYPTTVADVSDSWGAYRIDVKPAERDVLHRYADNGLRIQSDAGESADMTLEGGRRHLFWGKAFQILSEWAAEQRPEPCASVETPDLRMMNTGVSLTTAIPPDTVDDDGRDVPEETDNDPEC